MAGSQSEGTTTIQRDLMNTFAKYSAKKFNKSECHLRMEGIKASPFQMSRLESSLYIARAENCDADMVTVGPGRDGSVFSSIKKNDEKKSLVG